MNSNVLPTQFLPEKLTFHGRVLQYSVCVVLVRRAKYEINLHYQVTN